MRISKYNKEELQKFILEGKSNKEISEIYGVTVQAIGSVIKKFRIGRKQILKAYSVSDDEFKEIIKTNNKINEIGRQLGYKKVDGDVHKCIEKRCDELGIDLIITTKRKPTSFCINCGNELDVRNSKFCSSKCKSDYDYKQYIEKWKLGEVNGLCGEFGVSSHIKRYLREKYNNKCQLCEWDKINPYTGNVPLEVHHIDGDYRNNKEENLQLLCPNCHSLTETYKAHNKNGREGRKKYYDKGCMV